MKKVSLILLLLVCLTSFANNISIHEIRNLYESAATSEDACKKLIQQCEAEVSPSTVIIGYKGSATMMMAKYVFSPFSKLSKFSKGKELLEQAIGTDPNNVELRFLRFAAQTNAPSFLGYKKNITDDKQFLLRTIKTVTDLHLKSFILKYLNQSKELNDSEKKSLQ